MTDFSYFSIIRDIYTEKETMGNVFLNNKLFGYSLENTVRPINIKIKGVTAIMPGLYKLTIRINSNGEAKIYIDDVPLFTYTQCHGGNTVHDTNGCILIAKKRYKNSIQGSLEKKMIAIIQNSLYSYLRIENLNQLDP